MSIKKKDKLLLNLLEGEKHKHRVAMVTDEGTFNQHEPNSNMARMFVVMLLIHVVVIGGIIVYDLMNGEDVPSTSLSQSYKQDEKNGMPQPKMDLGMTKEQSLEEYSTYEWKSGDSIPLVAQKLEVSEDVLIKLNKVDQGRQINTNDVILYPKRPIVKAVSIGTAGAHGEIAKPGVPDAAIAAAEVPMNLALPGETTATTFEFSSTIEKELTPTPTISPGMMIQESPPPAVTHEASAMPVRVELPAAAPKVEEAPPAPEHAPAPVVAKEVEKPLPKAIPVPRPEQPKQIAPVVKAPVKKVAETPPPAKKEPAKASSGSTYSVQSGDTLYRIASKNGVSVSALQAANKNVNPQSLQIGMKINIPRK